MADWNKILSRGDVEDRRGSPGIIGGLGGLGIGGTILYIAVSYFFGGGDIAGILNQVTNSTTTNQYQSTDFQSGESYKAFASAVLGSSNDLWSAEFAKQGKKYSSPKLVLFRGGTNSGCGGAYSQIGPHYCPADSTIYLDETFFDELRTRFKAQGGDVAEAYVIAHEVGHNVQNQLGVTEKSGPSSNADSVKIELQADCYAGVWANSVSKLGVIKPGEINEAIDAAAAVGDDRIQKETTGKIRPESWTHGSSAERVNWFNQGFNSGDPSSCDTFR